jgi:hypothetical protein
MGISSSFGGDDDPRRPPLVRVARWPTSPICAPIQRIPGASHRRPPAMMLSTRPLASRCLSLRSVPTASRTVASASILVATIALRRLRCFAH